MAKSNMVSCILSQCTHGLELNTPHRFHLFCFWVCFIALDNTASAGLTQDRPVVVAENMIGVAMYELVCSSAPLTSVSVAYIDIRSVLVMTTWSAKLFESKQIELQFKSTRKQVITKSRRGTSNQWLIE